MVPVCGGCKEKFYSIPEVCSGICRICGKQLISEKELCMECREQVVLEQVDGMFPLFSYRLWNTNLLCRWKLEGERAISGFFAELVNERLSQIRKEKGDFVIVPVPPRPGKIRKEGWDQIEELCTFLEFRYNWKVRRILQRHTNVQQKTLDRSQRIEMIGKAYSMRDKVIDVPENVCLVDDVLTTGSTIQCCAKELKDHGSKRVYGVALFSVDR